MIKKLFLIIICFLSLFITGCNNKKHIDDGTNRIYLSDKYYHKGEFIDTHSNDINNLNNENYLLFTNNNYCNLAIPCDEIFQKVMSKYKIDILFIPFEEFKNTSFYNTVKFAPSVLIIKNNEIIEYLDAESNEDLDKYQDENKFEEWLNNYIHLDN